MTWNTPTAPVAGTVITVAWAVANIIEPETHLRLMTGNADPPGSSYVVVSTGTGGTAWMRVPTDAIADGAVTTIKLSDGSVTPVKLGGFGTASRVAATDAGGAFGLFQVTSAMIGQGQVTGGGSGNLSTTPGSRVGGVNVDENTLGYNKLSIANNPSAGQYLIFNGTQLQWTTLPSVNGVPGGLVAMVRTAAEIASGWARESQLDGRFPIGAGSTFSVTFTENTDYGSGWAHQHDANSLSVSASGSVSGSASGPNNTVTVPTASPGDATVIRSNATLSVSGSASVSGTATGNTTATAWMPPARAYVFVRKS